MHHVHIAVMTLDEYLNRENDRRTSQGKPRISDDAFGKRVGLSQSQISRLRRKDSRPSWETMLAIAKVTRNAVSANAADWPAKAVEAAE